MPIVRTRCVLVSLKALSGLVVAGLAALSTTATLGHVHAPAAPRHAVVQQAASTDLEFISGDLNTTTPALSKPAPPPAPEPTAGQPSTDQGTPAARPGSAPAPPAIVIGSAQQSYINADRAAAGRSPLSWSPCLAGIAAGQSAAMAARGAIFHGGGVTQDFGCGLGSAQTGENVGYWSGGTNDAQLNTMFMKSPEHRANIMGPYHYVGTAWVRAANGYGYITVEFA